MKVGDLVLLKESISPRRIVGIILEPWIGCGDWWTILTDEGEINWPGSQLEMI